MQNALRKDEITGLVEKYFSGLKKFIAYQYDLQKSNFFLWTPVILACGIGSYFSLSFEPPAILGGFGVLLAFSIYVIFKSVRSFTLILLIYVLGFGAATHRTQNVYTPIIQDKIPASEIIGYIRHMEKLDKGQGSRIVLDVTNIEDLVPDETPERIRLTLRKDKNVKVGQNIRILAGLNPPSAPLIPGGFDFRRYLYYQKIGAVGFAYNAPEILPEKYSRYDKSWKRFIEELRQYAEKRIYEILDADKASIAAALMVGKKNAIADDDRQAIRDAGLAHMLAISGLHVGIFAGTLFFILRFIMACIPGFALLYPIKKIAAVIAVTGAVFYMFLAGSPVTTQRAVFMISIVFLAVITDRSPISLRLVSISALMILLFKPESLLSVSFQMSFAAVTCLIYFYDVTRRFWVEMYTQSSFAKRLALYFTGVCITTVIASLATAPFALYHFSQVSFTGSAANLLAVPLFAFFVMPLALFSLLLMPFGLDIWVIKLTGIGIKWMLDISYWAASFPNAVFMNAMWPFKAFMLIISGTLFMILWKGKGKIAGLPILIAGIVLTQNHVMPDILISDSHKLFLFSKISENGERQIFVSSRRNDRFVLRNWEKLYGLPEKSALLLDYKGNGRKSSFYPAQKCGEQGCRLTLQNKKISFARSPYILKQECSWADLVISMEPVPKNLQCRSPYVIDKFDTWDSGVHAIWLSPDIRIKTVAKSQKNRPWAKF